MATIAGTAWRSEHESAWRDAFAVVAAAMLDGAMLAATLHAIGDRDCRTHTHTAAAIGFGTRGR